MRRLSALLGIACLAALDAPTVGAQLAAGFGPSARSTSVGASGWETAAQLSSSLRFDHPFGLFALDDVVERHDGGLRSGPASFSSTLATPSAAGFRLVATSSVERDRRLVPPGDRRAASAALSYRYAASGAWLGAGAERFTTPGLVAGLWRQIGSRATLSVGSTVRRGTFGKMGTVYYDSIFTDTSGWERYPRSGTGGYKSARLTWAETEARLGWTVGRVTLDGVAGWRPRVDSVRRASWVQGFATVALARNLALSLAAGTVTRQLPFAATSGRFASASLRFAPASLVRPKAPPQITPAAGAFAVRKNEAGEYVVSVRVPRARVVEVSGDFNGWHPLRLEQVRGDVWEAVLPIAPGTYHMNLRVDGERWIAPPGTTAIDDDFNGRVGLVIVR